MFTQVSPPHRWQEDLEFHYLRLTLLGFEDKDIVINLDKYGHLVVRGDRQLKENEYITFEETYEVPKDADIQEASGLFESNQIYCITIPKKQQAGQGIQHTISIPKPGKKPIPDNNPRALDNNPSKRPPSFHSYHSTKDQPLQQQQQQAGNYNVHNPLQEVTGDKSKKKFVLFIAIVIALLILAIVLIVKLRHHY